MDSGNPAEALPIYRELVRADPGNPGLVVDLGLALDMSGSKPEAIRQYQSALKVNASFFPALLLLGTAYLDLGQPAKAIDPLQRSLKVQPDSLDAQQTLAEALFELGRLPEAERRFREIARLDPKSSKGWYSLGLCYEGLAQRSFNALTEAAPGSAYWLDLTAESRLEAKQDYSAFYFYRQALSKMPQMRGVHMGLARVYEDTGHSDWAAVEEQKEKQLSPPDCPAQKLECQFQAGNFVEVIETSEGSTTPEAYYWRTRAYNKLALNAYSELGELPPSAESHELEAKIDSQRRQYAESAKEWREALVYSPGNRYLQTQLAIALYKSGDLAGAQALFEQILKEQPDAADLNFYLGDTLLNAQRPQAALPYLEKAVLRNPALLAAQKSIGLAYLQTGQADRAIVHLKAALPIDEDGSARYQLARAYQTAGKKELAAAMLKEYQQKQQAEQNENAAVDKDLALTPPD
jgi:tetratricopeptide (TPR) repeat protein